MSDDQAQEIIERIEALTEAILASDRLKACKIRPYLFTFKIDAWAILAIIVGLLAFADKLINAVKGGG